MATLSKIFGAAALIGMLTATGGCGGGGGGAAGSGNPATTNSSVTSPINATVNPNGTATTEARLMTVAAPAGAPGYLAGVVVTLPPNTVITAMNADGTVKPLTGAPSFTFTAPADSSASFSGTSGVPAPAGYSTLTSTAGAVDVQLTGAAAAIFDPAIVVTMPVPGKAAGEVINVYSVSGTTYAFLGSFTVTTAGQVSFLVSSLSWKVGDPNPNPGMPATTMVTTVLPTTTVMPTTAVTTVSPTTIATTVLPTTTTVPATLNGVALYVANCQICHGPLLTPATGRKIPNTTTVAIIRSLNMARSLTDAELLAIIAVLPP